MVRIVIQILITWPQKMAATSAMAIAPESPVTPTPLQLKKITNSRTLDIILSMGIITKYSDFAVLF